MIKYVRGDATRPQKSKDETALLVHVVNDAGGWRRGISGTISQRWPEPEQRYRQWFRTGREGELRFKLGEIQCCQVEPTLYVVNMLAQHGYSHPNEPAIRYDALERCLAGVVKLAGELDATVHGGKFGSGLAGGDWTTIEAMIERTVFGVPVMIYTYP